jgi:predicted amidophosphoribosyltransferase
MDPDLEELETPGLLRAERKLARNYTQFDAYRDEWNREWQKAMQARAMRRQRARQTQTTAPALSREDRLTG